MSTMTLETGHAGHAAAAAEGADRWLLREAHHPQNGTLLGFWVYLMSDCLIFAVLFAMYGVVGGNYAAGPSPRDLFDLELVAVNTAMLLFSSITYGFAMLEMQRNRSTPRWPGWRSPASSAWPSSASSSTSSST